MSSCRARQRDCTMRYGQAHSHPHVIDKKFRHVLFVKVAITIQSYNFRAWLPSYSSCSRAARPHRLLLTFPIIHFGVMIELHSVHHYSVMSDFILRTPRFTALSNAPRSRVRNPRFRPPRPVLAADCHKKTKEESRIQTYAELAKISRII